MLSDVVWFGKFATSSWAKFYTSASSPNPVTIVTRMPAGESLFIDFGDGPGGKYEVIGTDSNQTTAHTYSSPAAGTKITIVGDGNIILLRYFSIDSDYLTGNHPVVAGMANLQTLFLRNNIIGGAVPSLQGCDGLVNLYCKGNPFTLLTEFSGLPLLREIWYSDGGQVIGTLPSMADLPNLQFAHFENNQISGFAGGFTVEVDRNYSVLLDLTNNLLTSSAVNLILADALAVNFGTGDSLLLGGTGNAAPTGQGLLDEIDLLAAGCTVVTN